MKRKTPKVPCETPVDTAVVDLWRTATNDQIFKLLIPKYEEVKEEKAK